MFKTVFLKLNTIKDALFIKYREYKYFFDAQAIISFSDRKVKYVPKSKECLCNVVIFFTTKEWNGVKYHPAKQNENKNNIQLLRNQKWLCLEFIHYEVLFFDRKHAFLLEYVNCNHNYDLINNLSIKEIGQEVYLKLIVWICYAKKKEKALTTHWSY